MNVPVFDLHCDTALALLGKTVNEAGSLKKNSYHIDLERASRLEAYCQCFACYTTPMMQERFGASPVVVFEREIATIQREVEHNKNMIRLAHSMDEVAENRAAGKMSAVLTIEGPAGFDFDPELLENLRQVGFQISTLGWNEKNSLTGSNVTGGGLTDRGREYVREAQRLGMLVDVSHISDEGFWDIMEITNAPVIATHSNSRAVCAHSRNLTDDMFRAICQTGGVAGINQYASFLGEQPTLDTVCDHVFHFMELDPEGTHIALGGDLDGCSSLAAGFTGIESYPSLADRLMERGLTQENIQNIFWNNPFRVLQTVQHNT